MPGPQPATILVVEDDAGIASILQRRLEAIGHGVHVEQTGRGALAFAAEFQPDLVILDLRLPDLGGYEVCRALRSLYTRWPVPIMMLTGMDKPVDQLRGFAHGADAYLVKPFDLNEVTRTISELLGQAAPT